ncbi:FAS-associated factor 1 [Takifugu flavidus]|uniref:FAS-associated factor 1 n=1 Tax=Takifugu flavidus TaxID=433684 RepID=A0A5C6MSH6_9TELE|nr:FAS-associated factor 1 [Takifugu flavidus]
MPSDLLHQITQLDPGSTLLDAKLFPQETLFLEAKE